MAGLCGEAAPIAIAPVCCDFPTRQAAGSPSQFLQCRLSLANLRYGNLVWAGCRQARKAAFDTLVAGAPGVRCHTSNERNLPALSTDPARVRVAECETKGML